MRLHKVFAKKLIDSSDQDTADLVTLTDIFEGLFKVDDVYLKRQ